MELKERRVRLGIGKKLFLMRVVEVFRWIIKKRGIGSPVLLVPKMFFWVTDITQRGHIYDHRTISLS